MALATLIDTQAKPFYVDALRPDDYSISQRLAAELRASGVEGLIYPGRGLAGGECVALFYPDLAANAVQGRHLDYHWNGSRVDFYREPATAMVYELEAPAA